MADVRKLAVIGSGAAGCAAAWFLRQAGHHVTLYEKNEAPGGRIQTWQGETASINTGAVFFTNFYPLLWELLGETGLARRIMSCDKAVVLSDRQQRYAYNVASVRSFFGIPWLSMKEKLRVIRHTVGLLLRKTRFDLADPRQLARFDHQSIADYARQHLGDTIYQYLVRPAIEPYWYFSCEQASAALMMALQAEVPGVQFYTLRGGMEQIARALLKDVSVRFSTEVVDVRYMPDSRQVQLRLKDASETEVFDGVIVATQAHQAAALTASLDETLVSPEQRSFLAEQKYAACVTVWFRAGSIPMGDCGFQLAPTGPGTHGLAAWTDLSQTESDSAAPNERIVGAWLRDALSRKLLDEPDDVVIRTAWQEARLFSPELPEQPAEAVHLVRRRCAIPIPEPGRYRRMVDFRQRQKPPVVFAGDYLATATVEGALRSGQTAAALFGI